MDTKFLWLADAWQLSSPGAQSTGEVLINLEDVSSIAFQEHGAHDVEATIIMREGTRYKLRTSDGAQQVRRHVAALAHHFPALQPAPREGGQR